MIPPGARHFIRQFAATATPPHCACFSTDYRVVRSTMQGTLSSLRLARYATIRDRCKLKVFHWGRPDAAHRPVVFVKRRAQSRLIDWIEEFPDLDGTRREWGAAVDQMVLRHCPHFGFVWHCGTGSPATIHGDLAAIAPLVDDRTILMLPNYYGKSKPAFRVACDMAREDGWELIEILGGQLLILQWKRACHGQPLQEV